MTLSVRCGGGVGAREQETLSAALPVELRLQNGMTKESHLSRALGVW